MAASSSWLLTIDFGTSFTVTAVRVPGRPPEVIEIDGDRRLPSTVFCDEDGIVVGRAAEERTRFQPSRALRAPKARMGDKAPIILGGRPYRIVDLVAALLGHVAAEAQRHMGSPPGEVRLTHPATWSRTRQASLLDAATQAGLPNAVLVPEPVAAAVSYADDAGLQPGNHVLVYDLGGGTFDTAVLQATSTGFTVVGRPVGDPTLGGELFDEMLATLIGERLDPQDWEALIASDRPEWQRAAGALRAEARRVKETLSASAYADVLISLPTGMVQQRVTRDEFEDLIRPYIEDSVDIVSRVLDDAELTPGALTAIYLAGGASRTPLVSAVLAEQYPDVEVSRRGDPKLAVALGACDDRATPSDQAIPKPRTTYDTPEDSTPEPAPSPMPLPPPPIARPAEPTKLDNYTVVDSTLGRVEPPAPLPQPPSPGQAFGAPGAPSRSGGDIGPPPLPPLPPQPTGPYATPSPAPGRRPVGLIIAIAAAVVILLGVVGVLVLGGGDPSDVAAREDPDTTARRRATTTDEPTTTEPATTEAPTTTEPATTEPPTTTRPTLAAPPVPTPAPTEPPTTPPPPVTEPPPTTPAPPPPPPPQPGPTAEQLAAAVPSANDLPAPAEWVPVPDGVAIPVCEGFTGDNFPGSAEESRQVFSNNRTLQSAAGLMQSFDSQDAALNAYNAWTSLLNCPGGSEPEVTGYNYGVPSVCTNQAFYYADYYDDDGNFYLRSSVAVGRCGLNVGLWYYDETTDIDVAVSNSHVSAFFTANMYRLASLPS